MDGSATRTFFATAAAAAVTLAYVQVASVESTSNRPTSYTVESALDEVRTDIQVTLDRLRQERDERRAILVRMGYDLRLLEETLSSDNPHGFGK